jgi:protein-S-isoprenylcysteine O-methyltransferase Ste14
VDNAWGGLRAQLARRRVGLGFVTAVIAVIVARPTWTSWTLGLAVACAGEAIRVWAAGHIDKGREVTTSGPYRWMKHPLYVGSSVMAAGVMLAARSPALAVVATAYMVATIAAAVTSEEAHLRQKFGDAYDRYAGADGATAARAFSFERALRNREYRAITGLFGGFLILALKVAFNL